MPNNNEVLYNACYGGFGFSKEAIAEYRARGGAFEGHWDRIPRNDPVMVSVVRDLGARANGMCAKLLIASVPAPFETHFQIDEYDGMESVRVDHRQWFIDHTRAVLRSRLAAPDKVRAIAALSAQQAEAEADELD